MKARLDMALAASLVVMALGLAAVSHAQDIGVVAAVELPADIERNGGSQTATLGTTIQQGDTLRTGPGGRLRVIFADESVLSLTSDSEVLVDESIYDAGGNRVRSVMELLRGKVRAIVNENAGDEFELGTPTAVAGVRGTDFVVLYDDAAGQTEVVGVSGAIGVRSKLGVVAPEVLVREQQITRVARGKLPTKPERLDDVLFRQYLDGFEFIGEGRAESLAFGEPLLSGDEVPPDDRLAVPQPSITDSDPYDDRLPSEDPFDIPDVGTLLEQPPAAASGGPGELGVRF